ncbi:hypothetical protein SELMODRAFT_134659 [Selaginella moellendorffii]|uniref:Uncharacterized protein n=1 Tax=Selaginella moellendorffii TaxID=88036 RepID=D8T8U4_SELML|nr:hypothetical protein SELMODRAFT_134659 [Selaginella moellendorffii]
MSRDRDHHHHHHHSHRLPRRRRRSDASDSTKLVQHRDAISGLAISPSGKILYSGSWDKTIKSSDHRKIKHRLAASFHDHSSAVNALLLSRDSTLLYSGSGDKTVRVWARSNENLHDLRVVEILRGHRRAVLCLAATIDGELLCSGSADKSVRIWRGHCCVAALDLHCAPVKSLAMARDLESSSYTVYSSALDGNFKIYTALP